MARPKVSKIAPIPRNPRKRKYRGHLHLQCIPEDTKLAFKAACYRTGRTMRDVIIEFMRGYCVTKRVGRKVGRPPARDRSQPILSVTLDGDVET